MNNILKEYKKRCKEEFGNYGFKIFQSNHYRVVNDVFQSFNLHKSVSGQSCTVEFGIIPMSVGYELNKSSVNPCHLKNFEEMYSWFEYDKNSQESIDKCVTEMLICMKKYLMPLFEKAIDCNSTYGVMCKYDNVFRGNAYEKLCMCLKSGNYKNARKHLQEVIEQHEYAFMRNKEALGTGITQEYIQKMEEKISQKKMLLRLIDNKEYNVIQKLLLANETRNKRNLGIKD